MKILGIITARSGSARLPNKNILEIDGKSLVEIAYDEAIKSKLDKVVLSTDSHDIASLIPCQHILRPEWLSQDRTPHLPVIQHAVEYLAMEHDYYPDAVMTLQPTSPFRTTKHINEAIKTFESSPRDSLVSVDTRNVRNAAIYITSVKRLFDRACYVFNEWGHPSIYVMDNKSSIDINTREDYEKCL